MIPIQTQINHDINLLYALGRIYLPRQILEALLYGSDFDEPEESDTETLKQLIKANSKEETTKENRYGSIASNTDTLAEGLIGEEIWNSIYE